jgi:hypothetical protein
VDAKCWDQIVEGYRAPYTEVWRCEGQGERTRVANTDNHCSLGVPSMNTWGPIYKGSYIRSLHCP